MGIATPWPEWRMRFLLCKQPTIEQRERLRAAEQVSFVPMESVGENGGLNLDTVRNKDEVVKGYTLFFDGDVVVAKITPCFENGKGALATRLYNGVAYGTTELHVLSPQSKLDSRFLYYITISHAFRIQGEAAMKGAAGQKRVPDEFIQDYRFHLPSVTNQRRIADFLDAETTQIDALVVEKERMLALLEEKRAALISRAVTRGLDPDVPLKPSGLEWLGDIPAHWEIRRLGFLFILQGGCTPSKANDEFWKGEIAWASSKDIKQQILTDTEDHVSDEAMDKTGLSLIEPPVVLLVVRGMILAKRIPTSLTGIPVTINQDLKALKPDETWISPIYLKLLFDGLQAPLASLIEESAHGTKCFRTDLLTTFKVPLPPLPEQIEIISLLSRERTRTAELEETLQLSIAILKERRSALITAAVTGQLQISENQSSQ